VVIWYVLAIWGVKLLSSGRAAILGYTMPVWTALFGWLWVRWPDTIEWWAIAYNVFRVFGVSQLLWFRLATILPPVASSLSVMLIPVVGLFSGMALLGEQPTWHDWAALGCVLVAIASVLLPARCRDPRR
jgi:drug/metabolite transporter (DMT)-like permease